MKKRHLS